MSAEPAHLVHARTQPLLPPCDRLDPVLAAGKRHNVTQAAEQLDGLILRAGDRVSLLDRISGPRRFVQAWSPSSGEPFSEEGGGLSMLAQAVFELAVRTGAQICEHHPARFEVEGFALPLLDARVSLPGVDLCFVPRVDLKLVTAVRGHGLVVAAYADGALPFDVQLGKVEEHRTPISLEYTVLRSIRDLRGLVEHAAVARVRRLILGGEPAARAA